MQIKYLERYVRVCQLGSITKAAHALNVPQPALGMQMRTLENWFDTTLLIRTPRGVEVTDAGEILLKDAQYVLDRLRETKRRIAEVDKRVRRKLNLGMTPSLTSVMTQPLFDLFAHKFKQVDLQIYEEFSHELIDRVERRLLDLALAYTVPETRSVNRRHCFDEPLFFVCARGSCFDKPDPLPLSEIPHIEFAMPSERDHVRLFVENAMKANGLELVVAYQIESTAAIRSLVSRGQVCAILPYLTVAQDVADGKLAVRTFKDTPMSRALYLIWPSGRDEADSIGKGLQHAVLQLAIKLQGRD